VKNGRNFAPFGVFAVERNLKKNGEKRALRGSAACDFAVEPL
jgi:hypothetical protein